MRLLAIAVPVAIVALAVLLSGSARSSAMMQDGTPVPPTPHPLVGAWLLTPDVNDPSVPQNLAIFHDDGTFLETSAGQCCGIGVWEATGPNTAVLTIQSFAPDASGGAGIIRANIVVDASGNTFTADFTLELVAADETSSGEMGPGRAAGERIAVDPMGEPVGALRRPAATPAP
jgi:hypothetical protein